MKGNYSDLIDNHIISNTQIIAMINKHYPRLHNQSNQKRKK